MILTVATTPELFRTSTLDSKICWSHVNKLSDVQVFPAGGGVNVAQTLFCAGLETCTLVPAPEVSQFIRMLSLYGLPYETIEVPGPIPVRYLIDSPSRDLLQFIDPPMALELNQLAMLRDLCVANAESAEWVVFSGALPGIAHASWYVDVMRALRLYHHEVKIAISTSGQAFNAVLRQVYTTRPDLLVIDATEFATAEARNTALNTLRDAGVQHILVCHDRSNFDLYSGGKHYRAHFDGTPGKQWLPWIDAALAGILIGELSTSPQTALISALAFANAEIGDATRAVPTPDVVQPELVELMEV